MNTTLSVSEIALRLLAATAAGALVGWERESHGRAAGLRTTILTCLASAISMVVSELLFAQTAQANPDGNWRPDPARLGQGILTGIGFLGAGTILRHQNVIRGVTTAASLWFVTVLGLAIGAGHYLLGVFGVVIAMITLLLLPEMEQYIPSDWYAMLSVTMNLDSPDQGLRERLEAIGLKIKRVKFDFDVAGREKTIGFELKLHRQQAMELSARTVAELHQLPGVLRVQWE